MSGRYFLDTNALIQLLKGNFDVLNKLNNASYIGTSVICEIEFLSFKNLSNDDKTLFEAFLNKIEVVDVESKNGELISSILSIRKDKKLKLPDAIVCASAKMYNATLITADKALFKVKGIDVLSFESI